jgi:hypothetical protein
MNCACPPRAIRRRAPRQGYCLLCEQDFPAGADVVLILQGPRLGQVHARCPRDRVPGRRAA